ncbi:MAG: SGNH/GDSL hydrolase family protein [Planctomycetota bacterium]|nr:SGNH/GDSL hydrolase family protein [Planctomycetota bacterium]MDP6989125.1 SGNH/GDSL hydrolase family protein [Planctomycetota bacterium]
MSRRRPLHGLLLSLGVLLASLLLAEVGARLVYRAPWYERLAAEQGEHREFPYERNRYNLRGPSHDHPRPQDARRILFLGDSFTFGMGVERDEDTFVRILERKLSERLAPAGVEGVEAFNGAIIGSLTDLWVQVWDEIKARFEPDLVVIVFFLRDGTLSGSIPEFFEEIRDEIALRNRGSALYRASALFRTVRDARDAALIREKHTARFVDAYLGTTEQTAEWRRAQERLLYIRDDARERSVATAFVVFPILAGLDDDYQFEPLCTLLEEFAREAGLPTHSLLPTFRGLHGPDLWVSPHDQHPNERAHALAAESLLPFLSDLLTAH